MRSHEFITEAAVTPYKFTPLSLNAAKIFFKENCHDSAALLSKPIFRGMRDHNESYLTIDPPTGVRTSENTSNHFNSLIDNSPYFAGWPKRSKSLICTSSEVYADEFAGSSKQIYRILPGDNVKIAICPTQDIWYTEFYINCIERQFYRVDQFNNFLSEVLGLPPDYPDMVKFVKTREFDQYLQALVSDRMLSQITADQFLPKLLDDLTPTKLGFKLLSASQFAASGFDDSEIWIGGSIVTGSIYFYNMNNSCYNYTGLWKTSSHL